ncbi:hypothetical protein HYR99_34110 [Candidatus Poribacteria bacterium]|nr:hypothetical protein [Candidatus Poribacteria bacterium]
MRQAIVQQPPFWTQLGLLTNTYFVTSKEGWVGGGAEHWIQDRPWEHQEKGGIILKTTDGFNWVVQTFIPI